MYACKICTCVWGRKESPTEHKTGESLSFFFLVVVVGWGFWLGGASSPTGGPTGFTTLITKHRSMHIFLSLIKSCDFKIIPTMKKISILY